MEDNKDFNEEGMEAEIENFVETTEEVKSEEFILNEDKKVSKKKNKLVKGVGATIIDAAVIAIISFLLYSMRVALKVFGIQVVEGSEAQFFMLVMLVITFIYYAVCKSVKERKTIGDILL